MGEGACALELPQRPRHTRGSGKGQRAGRPTRSAQVIPHVRAGRRGSFPSRWRPWISLESAKSRKNQRFFAFVGRLYHRLDFIQFPLPGATRTVYRSPMMKNYIGYYRVSTSRQGMDGNGMTAQREIVRRFVE